MNLLSGKPCAICLGLPRTSGDEPWQWANHDEDWGRYAPGLLVLLSETRPAGAFGPARAGMKTLASSIT
jgi:hypothetical protein